MYVGLLPCPQRNPKKTTKLERTNELKVITENKPKKNTNQPKMKNKP
jgi:hypothetical protein